MFEQSWLDDVTAQYRWARDLCERAVAQVPDDALFSPVGPHSLGILMKHLGGNHRSRWRDFLTADGEKADRHRDGEFVTEGDTRESIQALWDEGWDIALGQLAALGPGDLGRTVTIRGEPHTVLRAIQRNLSHAVYHTGQIVQLARTLAGDSWTSLSIPPGESEAANARMRARYGDWNAGSGGPAEPA